MDPFSLCRQAIPVCARDPSHAAPVDTVCLLEPVVSRSFVAPLHGIQPSNPHRWKIAPIKPLDAHTACKVDKYVNRWFT